LEPGGAFALAAGTSEDADDPTLPSGYPTGGRPLDVGESAPFGYDLLEEVGRGGMGIVYRARQHQPNRIVAIKMIRSQRFASAADVQRFYNEAEAAANLDHDGVVPIYEVGQHDGIPFFSMKFVEGASLAQLLKSGEITQDAAVMLLRDVAEAVAHAHQRGIVHRDLKPSNILVERSGQPRVTDFGLVKYVDRESTITVAGDVMGTPGFMAPEQAIGDSEHVTAAADVYSLGAVLYRILTGRPPIQANDVNLAGLLRLIEEHDIMPPKAVNRRVPRDLNTICLKCLEKSPARRYANAGELADDLTCYLEGETILARPLGWSRQLLRWSRQQPGLAATWFAATLFYVYHLFCVYILKESEITSEFHFYATAVTATWCVGAWVFQRLLIQSHGRPRWLFAWATMDVLLLTLLLFATDGPKSALIVVYLALVASSVLRFRVALIFYVTGLSLAGYLLHVVHTAIARPRLAPTLLEATPFVLTLIVIGLIQYFALRRSRIASGEIRQRSSAAQLRLAERGDLVPDGVREGH
jgi:serine/threonine-protein kinase